MGEIVAELYTLKATISEIMKSIYKGAEANYRGVRLILLRDESDTRKIQKKLRKTDPQFVSDRELEKDTPTLFGHIILYSDVIPEGRFCTIYIQNGVYPDRVQILEDAVDEN